MAKFDLKGMLSERSTQEIDLPEQKTVYRNPEDLISVLLLLLYLITALPF